MPLDILHLRQEDWRAEFGVGDLQRGQGYAAQGRSRLLSLKDSTLLASCRGSGAQTYQQRITLNHYGQGWAVSGKCSCPVGFNCKHVASALLTLQTQQEQGVDLSPLIVSSPEAREERLEGLQPSPVLSLGSLVRVHFDARKGRMQEQTQHRAALAFDYQGHLASGKSGKDLLIKQNAQHSLRIVRDISSETQLRKRLQQTGLQVALRQSEALPESAGEAYEQPNDAAWLQFVREQLPLLREEGWQIRMQPDFQFNLTPVDDWYAEVEEDPEQNWFDLELGIEVEGQRISLLPILLQAIRRAPWLLNGEALNKRDD
ncbi:MAG: SWIM zinc finger family protein, partial [Gammaproteobacteria bacterium]|nr:SWIM zinc finger family protein [Gammaproteobacteria bacterium]